MDTLKNNWNKLRLVLWKNFLLIWRNKKQFIVEILVPILFCFILLMMRIGNGLLNYDRVTTFQPFEVDTLNRLNISYAIDGYLPKEWKLAYMPKNAIFEDLLKRVSLHLGLNEPFSVSNSTEMESVITERRILAGVRFHHEENDTTIPKQLAYSLRFPSELRSPMYNNSPMYYNWQTDLIYTRFGMQRYRALFGFNDGDIPNYSREGFLSIQNAIAGAYFNMTTKANIPNIRMQRFPYPRYETDHNLEATELFLPFVLWLSLMYFSVNTIRFITIEKERQLKEAMKIMGLPNWIHWIGWFIKSYVYLIIIITVLVAVLKVSFMNESNLAHLTYSQWTVVWVFFAIYGIATVTYCFMLSVFFSKANTAATVASFVWFLTFAPYIFNRDSYDLLATSTKVIFCLFSNSALGFGIQLIMRWETAKYGLKWSNLWDPVTSEDDLTVGLVMVLMLISSMLYMLIALYVEKVFPGQYGVPEKWYFFIAAGYWNPKYKRLTYIEPPHNKNTANIEPDPENLHAGIRVNNLRKVYGNKKVAVRGLTINMFDDQITVLLGHNGAGKTTTMSMLTGMFPPTCGTAHINGYDIQENLNGARNSLGLCPQHNILFDELTVREHLLLYCRLKGMNEAAAEEELTKYVRLLQLEDKINAQSRTLSGGMKRKLSVAIAFCGHSKVVLCDEPSSGLDPSARRVLWDFLESEKKGRTVLLSTHFMDEADVLGDRIAIMADGELKCCGSSFFLKKRFGAGYQLICVRNNNCRSNEVTQLLQRHIPNVKLENDIGTELTYELPDDCVDLFQNMFADLENNSEKLGLSSYGVSLTTLEDVFLKVGVDSTKLDFVPEHKNDASNGTVGNNENDAETGSIELNTPLLTGIRLVKNQWHAMFKKRLIYATRNFFTSLTQLFVMFVIILIISFMANYIRTDGDLPPLELSINSYKSPVSILETREKVNDLDAKIVSEYSKGTGTKIVTTNTDLEAFYIDLANTKLSEMEKNYLFGASIGNLENHTITAWFNNIPYHAAPVTLNLVHNAIARALISPKNGIRVINDPVPFTPQSREIIERENVTINKVIGIFAAIGLCFGMAYASSFYIMFYIKERKTKAKLLQFVSGVNVFTFWFSALLWDLIILLIMVLITMASLTAFNIPCFSTIEELGRTSLMLMVFGFAMLPMTYLLSMLFSIPSTGFSRSVIINILTGLALGLLMYSIQDGVMPESLVTALNKIAKLSPHYALWNGMLNLQLAGAKQNKCDQICPIEPTKCCKIDFFSWEEPGIAEDLVYLFCTGAVLLFILFAFECGLLQSVIYSILRHFRRDLPQLPEDESVDSDVLAEKHRIKSMSAHEIASHNLVMRDVSKFYGSFLAVNQVSVAIKEAECFGLLGVNGAGKTSIFKMLTGDLNISSGEAWLRGVGLKEHMQQVYKKTGYCPQFDALLEELTGRETLEIFSLLRGIPNQLITHKIERLAHDLKFFKHLRKKISAYSGGNKRKLSTAIALIGNPDVIYLDEPTTGMDPGAKRHLWAIVSKIRDLGKSIVLTSHSMEECEALCTRLVIMVNGEFKCLGSTQHLKSKFSKGYSLKVKVKQSSVANLTNKLIDAENVKNVKNYIETHFAAADLQEDYQGLLTYYVPPSDTLKWSTMFGLMETAKKQLPIEDYSVYQTSLEQVFLSLSKLQHEEVKSRNSNFSIFSSLRSLCSKKQS